MKFKTKSIEVDAVQWDGTLNGVRHIESLYPTLVDFCYESVDGSALYWRIYGLEPFCMQKGHWLMLNKDGYFSSLPPDKFAELYFPCST